MEYGGSWSIDSESSFEKMETGVNARAIDFAKFGVLYLNGGNWNGDQVIPQTWVDESTQPLLVENYAEYYHPALVASFPGQMYYKYMWWGMARGADSYDFAAIGDKGQYIYISSEKPGHRPMGSVWDPIDRMAKVVLQFVANFELASQGIWHRNNSRTNKQQIGEAMSNTTKSINKKEGMKNVTNERAK
jgi:hypothetical protein